MNKYNILAYAISNKGHVRENNEDNYLLNGAIVDGKSTANNSVKTDKAFVCAVCDGVGGQVLGEEASKIAVKTIDSYSDFLYLRNITKESVNDAIMFANDKICETNEQKHITMGSTIAMLGITDENVIAANVGESRIYKYSEGKLTQLSKDHTREQVLLDVGLEVNNSNDKHILTQHLGINPKNMIIEPYIIEEPVDAGSIYYAVMVYMICYRILR